MEAHQKPLDGAALELELKVWDYALAEVPTHHIPTLLKRAFAAKRDDYPMRSALLLREWDAMKEDLKREAQSHANEQYMLLQSGHGTLGRMHIDEFKARHNLPAAWQLGDPYPPESDLHGREGKALEQRQYEMGRDAPHFDPKDWDPKWYMSTRIKRALGIAIDEDDDIPF